MAISTAIDLTRISRAVGYKVSPANFDPNTPYLPQRIIVLGEANDANQATLDTDPYEFISAKEAGAKYGYGSPIHQMARILRPISGSGVGGIPTIAIPQTSDAGATAAVYKLGIAVATSVTANATHKVYINGRDGVDGTSYDFTVTVGDVAADVRASIIAAINNVLSSPVVASENVNDVDLTTKWNGATATLLITIDTQDEDAGIVYSEVSNTAGTGVVDISDALATFGETWNTLIINSYGAAQFSALETFNGNPNDASGRYNPISFKPYLSFFGSKLSDKDDVVAITNVSARQSEVTNVLCPAPNTEMADWEAAANVVLKAAPIMQNTPHIGASGKQYQDGPIPLDDLIGDFSDYSARDFMVKKGASTVNLKSGKYNIQDLITTYVPEGETPPKFRFVRDLNVDWNVAFNVITIMENEIQDKAIVADNVPTSVTNVIKPKQVKSLFTSLFKDLVRLALIADADYSASTLQVEINETNPARLDIFFRYKRTSTAHQISTDSEVDFNYTF